MDQLIEAARCAYADTASARTLHSAPLGAPQCCCTAWEEEEAKRSNKFLRKAIAAMEKQRPFLLRMAMQSFDYPSAESVGALSQWFALCRFAGSFSATHARDWLLPLLRHFVASVDALAPDAATALFVCVQLSNSKYSSAPLILSLLELGADLHAVDMSDQTLLHVASAETLVDLADAGVLIVGPHWKKDDSGNVGWQYQRRNWEYDAARLLKRHSALWKERARPLLLRMLSQPSVLIPDLAAIVLDYVDGGEEEAKDDNEEEEDDDEHGGSDSEAEMKFQASDDEEAEVSDEEQEGEAEADY